jgi:dolichol-phosphate mannosyltransferase
VTSFSVIIPTYNESNNIERLVLEIFNSLSEYKNYELIIVDDGSKDNSLNVIKNIQKNHPVKLLEHNKNLGQSRSIYTGIQNSSTETIVTLDGDGQNNPKDIPKLLEIYFSSNNITLVSGIRMKRKDNLIKIISSKIANSIRSYILEDNCPDTGCSLKVFQKNIFLNFPYFDGIHRFIPALFNGYDQKIQFIPVDHRLRTKGISKYGIVDRLFKGIYDLFRVKRIINQYKKIK